MPNRYPTEPEVSVQLSEKDLKQQLMMVLLSEAFERGESIDEVLRISKSYKVLLESQLTSPEVEEYNCLFWNLDNLIHEATNMLQNPTNDLFLYLRAFHGFKGYLLSTASALSLLEA